MLIAAGMNYLPPRELPILIDGLFCLLWKRNRRKKSSPISTFSEE